MSFFGRLKKPREIKALNKASDILFDTELDELADELGFRLALNLLNNDVKNYINDRRRRNGLINQINQGKSYNEIIQTIMLFRLQSCILSGEYHLYRDTLNDTGKSMLRLYNYIIDWFALFDIISLEDAEEAKEDIREGIRGVG